MIEVVSYALFMKHSWTLVMVACCAADTECDADASEIQQFMSCR
jgi:hypothetical protein